MGNTVVIGTGIAGIAAVKKLKENKIDAVVISKDSGLKKLCGGLMTHKAKESWGFIPETAILCRHNEVRLMNKKSEIARAELVNPMYSIDRQKLLGAHIDSIDIIEGRVVNIDIAENKLWLIDGTIVLYENLIIASGASKDLLGVRDSRVMIAAMEAVAANSGSLSLDIGYKDPLYQWSIPVSSRKSLVGSGISANHRNIDIVDDKEMLGNAPIPCGYNRSWRKQAAISSNIYVIGDAIGAVDPMTCEGLYFATCGANAAVESIINKDRSHYIIEMERQFKIIKNATLFSRYVMLYKNRLIEKVKGHNTLFSFLCNDLVNEYKVSYNIRDLALGYLEYKYLK